MRRYVHGPGTDEPAIWYEGADRRWLLADERGSIVAEVPSSGAVTKYTYDPYGAPSPDTGSRFRYTGQMWLPEIGLYHYKARG
ncbi:MAG: hypothetical protein U1E87_01465 [Alphaproteobacteria bacterium]